MFRLSAKELVFPLSNHQLKSKLRVVRKYCQGSCFKTTLDKCNFTATLFKNLLDAYLQATVIGEPGEF